jgi:hypothetical protein
MTSDEIMEYHINKFSPKVRDFARAQYLHIRNQTPRQIPEDYGLEPWQVSDVIIRIAQISPKSVTSRN